MRVHHVELLGLGGLLAMACRAVGDDETTGLELRAARATFERLGSAAGVRRVDELSGTASGLPGELTQRQLEVLRLVAAGKTNREIAADLVISAHTVARHLDNIYAKLGVSSRAARGGLRAHPRPRVSRVGCLPHLLPR